MNPDRRACIEITRAFWRAARGEATQTVEKAGTRRAGVLGSGSPAAGQSLRTERTQIARSQPHVGLRSGTRASSRGSI
jgi:hypothetical protein